MGRGKRADIKPILEGLGLASMFPSFDAFSFYKPTNKKPPFLFRDIKVEDISEYTESFKQLTLAVQNHHLIDFEYKQQNYLFAQPYKLVNDRGVWYSSAIHNGKLKSFKVTKLSKINIAVDKFEYDATVEHQIQQQGMLWLTEAPIEVVVKIDASIASHFKASKLLPEQAIIKELDDGCLLAIASITNKKQILPILKYWLPDIEILSPKELKQTLLAELQLSIDKMTKY